MVSYLKGSNGYYNGGCHAKKGAKLDDENLN